VYRRPGGHGEAGGRREGAEDKGILGAGASSGWGASPQGAGCAAGPRARDIAHSQAQSQTQTQSKAVSQSQAEAQAEGQGLGAERRAPGGEEAEAVPLPQRKRVRMVRGLSLGLAEGRALPRGHPPDRRKLSVQESTQTTETPPPKTRAGTHFRKSEDREGGQERPGVGRNRPMRVGKIWKGAWWQVCEEWGLGRNRR